MAPIWHGHVRKCIRALGRARHGVRAARVLPPRVQRTAVHHLRDVHVVEPAGAVQRNGPAPRCFIVPGRRKAAHGRRGRKRERLAVQCGRPRRVARANAAATFSIQGAVPIINACARRRRRRRRHRHRGHAQARLLRQQRAVRLGRKHVVCGHRAAHHAARKEGDRRAHRGFAAPHVPAAARVRHGLHGAVRVQQPALGVGARAGRRENGRAAGGAVHGEAGAIAVAGGVGGPRRGPKDLRGGLRAARLEGQRLRRDDGEKGKRGGDREHWGPGALRGKPSCSRATLAALHGGPVPPPAGRKHESSEACQCKASIAGRSRCEETLYNV